MAKEVDFYSPEEAARVLGISERQVFGMLTSGELEGHQDAWARWRISAGAVRRLRQDLGPSPGGSTGDGAEPRAAEDEERGDAAATTVGSVRGPLFEPPGGASTPGDEEPTRVVDEAPSRGGRRQEHHEQPPPNPGANSSDEETTQRLPGHGETTLVSAASVRELTKRLALAAAEAGELRARLELAEAAQASLREDLERERQRADWESARAERERRTSERLEEELKTYRNKGFWEKLFGD